MSRYSFSCCGLETLILRLIRQSSLLRLSSGESKSYQFISKALQMLLITSNLALVLLVSIFEITEVLTPTKPATYSCENLSIHVAFLALFLYFHKIKLVASKRQLSFPNKQILVSWAQNISVEASSTKIQGNNIRDIKSTGTVVNWRQKVPLASL